MAGGPNCLQSAGELFTKPQKCDAGHGPFACCVSRAAELDAKCTELEETVRGGAVTFFPPTEARERSFEPS